MLEDVTGSDLVGRGSRQGVVRHRLLSRGVRRWGRRRFLRGRGLLPLPHGSRTHSFMAGPGKRIRAAWSRLVIADPSPWTLLQCLRPIVCLASARCRRGRGFFRRRATTRPRPRTPGTGLR
jgi:hypothetical protein